MTDIVCSPSLPGDPRVTPFCEWNMLPGMRSFEVLALGIACLAFVFLGARSLDVHKYPGSVLILLFLFVGLPVAAIGVGLTFFGLLATFGDAPWLTLLGLLALIVFGGGWLFDRWFPRRSKETDPNEAVASPPTSYTAGGGTPPGGADSATREAVAQGLRAYGRERQPGDEWGGTHTESGKLLTTDPFAFLVAVACDRFMVWRKAWQVPLEIHRKGLLEPRVLAEMSRASLVDLVGLRYVQPYYGPVERVQALSDAARLVTERFGGDASAIWKDASPKEVSGTLQEIHGMTRGTASMATRILYDDFGCFRDQEHEIDVNPHVYLVTVFRRAGLIGLGEDVMDGARRASPDFPGCLDWPATAIGRQWCHAQPKCRACSIAAVCPRRGVAPQMAPP